MPVVNISCYKFVTLSDRESLQADLSSRCVELGLKGTILLAPEGINVFLAGTREAIDAIVAHLRADPRLADLQPKESLSSEPPFKRMRVRLKKEIITMKHPLIRPETGRAPAVAATTLKKWLDRGTDDEGRPVVMLDTRNDYEVAAGTFANAVDYNIGVFSEFPPLLAAAPRRLRRENRGVILHRRHPLRKSRHPHEGDRHRACVSARRRHSQIFRGGWAARITTAIALCSTNARP